MADTSLIIGNGNWAVKETSLLGYNIIQSKYVPIEMTVSRNTTATRVNSAGLIELVPRNLLTYSEQFDNFYWTKTNTVITANSIISPDGTLNADLISYNSTTNVLSFITTNAITSSYTISVFAKKGTTNVLRIRETYYFGTLSTFDLNVGTVLSGTGKIENYGNGWYRCSITQAYTNLETFINWSFDSNSNINNLYLWGAQLEQGTTATEYFPTTDRFNIPRVDYLNSTTGSLLVEPTRTNSIVQSSNLLTFSTTNANVIRTSGEISPGVTNNAFKIIAGAVNNKFAIYSSDVVTTIGNTYSVSIFLKSAEYSKAGFRDGYTGQYVTFNLNTKTQLDSNGLTVKFENYANGYVRVIITYVSTSTLNNNYFFILNDSYTTGSPDVYTFTGNGTSGLFMWGPQHELGSNATSYIPTTIQALARTADVITKTGISSLIGQTEGTLFVDFNNTLMTYASTGYLIRIFADANNEVWIRKEAGSNTYTVRWRANSVNVVNELNIPVLNGNNKIAIAYKSTNSAVYLNGNEIRTSAGTGAFSVAPSIIGIGSSGTAEVFNDRIELATVFQTRLSKPQCETLTT